MYMDPDNTNISDYCSEVNNNVSCGLLVREKGSEVRCRFDSCVKNIFMFVRRY